MQKTVTLTEKQLTKFVDTVLEKWDKYKIDMNPENNPYREINYLMKKGKKEYFNNEDI